MWIGHEHSCQRERSAVCDAVRRGQRAGRVSCVFESDARGVASSSRNVVRTIRFFLPLGADPFKRDNLKAEVHFYDTGHFALGSHNREIADTIREFLDRKLFTEARDA